MLTALSDPKALAEIAVVVALAAMNLGSLGSFALAKWNAFKAGLAGGVTAPAKAPADRTPGEVLDCLNADLDFLRTNTDAPAELLKQVEAVAPYLMHRKPAPSLAAPSAPGVSA